MMALTFPQLNYRNGMDLIEAEDIKKRWQKYTEELYKKDLHNPDNHDGVITDLESVILKREVNWVLGSITINKANGGDRIPVTAKSLQSCPILCDPIDSRPPGSPSLGFSRQEYWSGLPFPSLIHENEVAHSCPTLSSLPGSSVHGIFQARLLVWVPYEINIIIM